MSFVFILKILTSYSNLHLINYNYIIFPPYFFSLPFLPCPSQVLSNFWHFLLDYFCYICKHKCINAAYKCYGNECVLELITWYWMTSWGLPLWERLTLPPTAVISASSSLSRVGRYKSSPSDVSLFTSIALVQVFFRQRCCENGNSRLSAWLHPELIKTQVGGYVYEKDPLLYSW